MECPSHTLSTSKRKILVCCFGSRGDIQPFAALSRGLQDVGFDVLGMTNINDGVSIFESLGVKSEGVHFDMAEFLRNDPKMKKAMETGNALQFGITMGNAFAEHFPKEFCAQWEVAKKFQPHLIVASTLTFLQGAAIGQALRIPVVHADLGIFSFLPISKHTETELHEPKWLHKMASFVCVGGMLIAFRQKNKDGDSIHSVIREKVFAPLSSGGGGLDESERLLGQDGAGQFAREWMNPMTPNLFAISDSVLPKARFTDLPPLYSKRSIWTGNWYVSKSIQEELSRKGDPNFSNKKPAASKDEDALESGNFETIVLDFIEGQRQLREAEGKQAVPPVYIGWGSMIAVSPEHMTRMAVQSLKLADLPGIILGGFARLNIDLISGEDDKLLYDYAKKHVLFLQSAPHDWLFPHCSVTVHHGGAGTTAAALRSGVPTIVTPCIADQYDNASMVKASGCGIGFKKPLRKITESQLASAVMTCVGIGSDNDSLLASCKRVSDALAKENGVANAVKEIHTFLKEEVDSGRWQQEFESRLEQRAKSRWTTWKAIGRLMIKKEPFLER